MLKVSSLCRGVCSGESDKSHEPVLASNVFQVCELPQGAGRHRLCQEPGKVSSLYTVCNMCTFTLVVSLSLIYMYRAM